MHTNEPRELQGVELGYDPRDIDSKGIYKIVVYFFLFAVVFFGGGAIVYTWKGWGIQPLHDARKPAIAGPKVQGNIAAKVDIMTMRQKERRLMENYEELPNGKWRIPVEHAMDLVVEQGLPKIESDQPAVSPGNTIPQNAIAPAGGESTPETTTGESHASDAVPTQP